MRYKKIKIPNPYGVSDLGYVLDIESINNTNNCMVIYCIPEAPTVEFLSKNVFKNKNSVGNVLDKFSKEKLPLFKKEISKALKYFFKKYKPYPNRHHITSNIIIVFDTLEQFKASVVGIDDDYKSLQIGISLYWFEKGNFDVRNSIAHELYHPISKLLHDEDEVHKKLRRFQDVIKKKTLLLEDSEGIFIDEKILDMISHIYEVENDGKLLFQISEIFKRFKLYFEKFYYNIIIDSALTVIAIENEDNDYISYTCDEDNNRLYYLKQHIVNLNKTFKKMSEKTECSIEKLVCYQTFCQFIYCIRYMPRDSIAYHVLSNNKNWKHNHPYSKLEHNSRSSQIISTFYELISQNCTTEASLSIKQFYSKFLETIDAQKIHNDPLNPNIKQQIHNIESHNKSIKAYKFLNREIKKLYSQIQSIV